MSLCAGKNMNKKLQSYLLLLTILATSGFSTSSIGKETLYKWVDTNGVTHYSANRPMEQTAEKLAITDDSPSGIDPTEDTEAENTEVIPVSVAEPQAPSQKNPQKCAQARLQLQQMAEHARIRAPDETTGEPRFLTEQEKEARMATTKDQIQLFCD
jgi:hypothetical protein